MKEKLIELLETVVSPNELLCYGEVLVSTSRVADHLIANDVVPVVRCKDCKHWCTVDCAPNYGSCSKLEDRYKEDSESSFDETTRFDDFCSYGERKDT